MEVYHLPTLFSEEPIYFCDSFILFFILVFSCYQEDSENTLTLTFAGDAIPQFMIRNILDNRGESGIISIFSLVTNYLKDTISFYNLETTISENPAPFKAYTFQVQPDFLLARESRI